MVICIIISCARLAICIEKVSCGPREDRFIPLTAAHKDVDTAPKHLYISIKIYVQVQMALQLGYSCSKTS